MATAALRERDLLTCRSCRRRTGADAASPGVLFPALWAVDRFGVVGWSMWSLVDSGGRKTCFCDDGEYESRLRGRRELIV
jgi:hypothetical protein